MTTREVTIDGGSPWGFRINGGSDLQQPIRISRVNPGSKAANKGIREGDIITSINGQSTKDKTNSETHLLLKTAGDVLKLGLNEEGVSPKKRQYRTVQQQETHSSETTKRTNSTIHVVTTTNKKETHHIDRNISTNLTNNNNISFERNVDEKQSKINGGSHNNQGQDCFSEKSTISSNYSSPASTPSTLTDTQGGEQLLTTMPDTTTSKSKKRRRNNGKSNNNKRKNIKNVNEITQEENYRVESPKTIQGVKKKGQIVKSKSLDDDDESLKIQEISTETFNENIEENSKNNNVIIDDLEEIKNLNSNLNSDSNLVHKLSKETLKTNSSETKFISPEDESKLRCFLEGLNLPSTPEVQEVQIKEKESSESIRAKRSKNRSELAQYFLPVYQNPRFLDVISEENSDQSDKENKDVKESKKPRIQRYIPTFPNSQINQITQIPQFSQNHKKVETVLVEREDIELPIISDTCTVSVTEKFSEGVEIVFLDDDDDSQSEDDEPEIPSSQLTPPPTPDSDSSNIEDEELIEEPIQPIEKTCCLTPKPSRSPSYDREDSSSRGTSLCTTICSNLPKTLRELCLEKLVSLPFGEDVLEELANVSMSLQELTNNIPKENNINNSNFGIAENKMKLKVKDEKKEKDEWVGIQTEDNPQVVVCLSPTQKEHLETTKVTKREADNLLDLHNKFIERSYYSDTEAIDDVKYSKSNGESRLLALIHDITPRKEIFDANPRLQAKNLDEWLSLAQNEPKLSFSKIESKPILKNRRRSLPNEIYVQQMQSIIQKEKEIQQELEKLEEEKRRLQNEMEIPKYSFKFDPSKYHISKNEDIAILNEELKRPKLKLTQPSTENFRNQMYNEYLQQIAERQERKHHKMIKISSHHDLPEEETHQAAGIKDEFMSKLKEKRYCYKGDDDGNENENENEKENDEEFEENNNSKNGFNLNFKDGKIEEITVIDGKKLGDSKRLPKHLKEFVDITRQASENLHLENENPEEGRGIWTPGQRDSFSAEDLQRQPSLDQDRNEEPIAPVWTPKSAGSSPQFERKEFRPVSFHSPVLNRKNQPISPTKPSSQIEPPWRNNSRDFGQSLSSSLQKRIPNSHSAPPSGFSELSQTPRLPRAQNPTIILLQKAREGQLPKGASYIEEPPLPPRKHESPPKINPGEIVYEIKNEYTSESESERPKRIADLGPRKFPGIGPTTKDGMPLTLRSEVRDQNQSKWYKKMYDTIHKQKPRYDDDYVTIRYKHRRGRYPYTSGYVSEPEPGAYDSDSGFYHPSTSTLDRRRPQEHPDDTFVATYTMPRTLGHSYSLQSDVIKHGKDVYKNQPGRIENYIPGHSSISEKEAKEWWDEVMDIFDGHLEQQKHIPSKGYMSQALKESGYESDSTLVFRRREDALNQLSPSQQKEAYRTIQKGGDVPLHGLRKPAPERPKEPDVPIPPPKTSRRKVEYQESPRKYVENEVTIHYKTPVRQEVKESVSEDELQRRQAEHMKKVYQEERRRKYLQVSQSVDHIDELQDMNSRRHTDNFIPSQKSPIPLNRYDDFIDDYSPKLKPRPKSPEPRLVAKALYTFVGQTARELTFRKGDIIYIRRQIDKNWYEGEHNAMVGLFPANYVEIIPYDGLKSTIRKSYEGQARAKYNFIAQTHLELSLAKGELVVITRRVDDNWFEGKIGGRKGIFPVSYVEVLIDPSDPPQIPVQSKPVASPAAHSLLLNGSLGGKESMGSHNYVPASQNTHQNGHQNGHGHQSGSLSQNLTYHAKPVQITGSLGKRNPLNQELHVDTHSEPYVPYRALYKYKPQNEDEIELNEGDTVYVLEKCDDGWFVGASDRTGALGTFPGNYVERI